MKKGSLEHKTKIHIPMPLLDSKGHPGAIAVPFKVFTLRNVESKSSAYILVKYYIAARKCLLSQKSDEASIKSWQSDFLSFLNRRVLPHLGDEKFYAAFGGVLRVVASLKKEGVKPSSESEYNRNVLKLHGPSLPPIVFPTTTTKTTKPPPDATCPHPVSVRKNFS